MTDDLTELVRKKETCDCERTHLSLNNDYYTVRGVIIRVRSSGFLTEFCSNVSSTQVKQSQHCRHILSGLQHLRPCCRRYSFQQNTYENEKLWFEMQRNKGQSISIEVTSSGLRIAYCLFIVKSLCPLNKYLSSCGGMFIKTKSMSIKTVLFKSAEKFSVAASLPSH